MQTIDETQEVDLQYAVHQMDRGAIPGEKELVLCWIVSIFIMLAVVIKFGITN